MERCLCTVRCVLTLASVLVLVALAISLLLVLPLLLVLALHGVPMSIMLCDRMALLYAAYRRSSVRIKRTDFSNYLSKQSTRSSKQRSDALDRGDGYDDHSDSDDYDEDLRHLESDEDDEETAFPLDRDLNFKDEACRMATSAGSRHSYTGSNLFAEGQRRPNYIEASTSTGHTLPSLPRSPGKNLTGASSASALMMMSTSPPCPEDSFLQKHAADDLGSAELDILLDEADADDIIKSAIRIRGRRATTAGSRIGSRNSNGTREKDSTSPLSGDEMDHKGRRFLSVNVTAARSVNSLADVQSSSQRRPSTHQRSCSSNYLEVPTSRFGGGNGSNSCPRHAQHEFGHNASRNHSMTLLQPRSHSCQNTRSLPNSDRSSRSHSHSAAQTGHRNSCFDRRNSGYHSWNVSPLGSPSSPRQMEKSYSARTSLAGASYFSDDESFDPVLALNGLSPYGSDLPSQHHRSSIHSHSYSHSQPERNFNPPTGGSSCRSGSINSHSSYCFDRSVPSSKFPSPSSPRSLFSDRSSTSAFGSSMAANGATENSYHRSPRSLAAFDSKSSSCKEATNKNGSKHYSGANSGHGKGGSVNRNSARSWQLMSPSSPVSTAHTTDICTSTAGVAASLSFDFPRSFAQSTGGSRRPFVLQRSLFANVSPTIYFASDEDDATENMIVQLPKELRQYLKWKLSSITPALVRETVIRSGFKLIKEKTKTKKWLGTWCKHIKSVDFSLLNYDYNKVNHFPGSFHLGRKDKLWFNLQEKSLKFGEAVFSDFHPATYVLPQDVKLLRRTWISSNGDDWKMILKPPASARGNGITVINKWSQIPKSARMKKRHYNKPVLIAQEYISNPCLLFNQSKFDLRVYVLVTSFNPLRIYIYEDGLVRFASEKYTSNQESLSDPFVHLTNYSINKTNESYKSNNEPGSKKGHKWTMNTLWKYLNEMNLPEINVDSIKAKINDMIIKTLISCEDQINKLVKKHLRSRYTCFELLGFDIMIDRNFKPWLLEVNISPSLRSESSLDSSVKGKLIKDMLNIVGYRLPSAAIKAAASKLRKSVESGNATFQLDPDFFPPPSSSGSYVFADDKFFSLKLSKEEKAKHFKYENEMSEYNYASILDELTPDDTRILIETEDEFSRRGGFHRIFPGSGSDRYMKYFDENRYYNILLYVWHNRYDEDPAKGRRLNFTKFFFSSFLFLSYFPSLFISLLLYPLSFILFFSILFFVKFFCMSF